EDRPRTADDVGDEEDPLDPRLASVADAARRPVDQVDRVQALRERARRACAPPQHARGGALVGAEHRRVPTAAGDLEQLLRLVRVDREDMLVRLALPVEAAVEERADGAG